MAVPAAVYRSSEEDSRRWLGFPFRDGDIVISTRSKSGTTWMQMICALLVFQTPSLPGRLSELSPWLDWLVVPRSDVLDLLRRQEHRRVLKTHTPLDGVPLDPRATYIVVARDPLDTAVSLYHQGDNLDRERIARLTGNARRPATTRPDLRPWLLSWIDRQVDPREELDSLQGILWHLGDAWARRHRPNVLLVHYADLLDDLEGQMRGLACRLGIAVPDPAWPELVAAATFESMKARAPDIVPDPSGVLKSSTAFFREGTRGAGRALLDDDELARYHQRLEELAPADLLAWLNRPPH